MTTRRRSTLAVVLGIMAVMLAPVHAAAYDANANRPDPAARFTLPDLSVDDMDPFGGDTLIPRRAMEHPHEWYEGALWGMAGIACAVFCSVATGMGMAVGGFAYAMLTMETGRTEDIYLDPSRA